MVNELQKRIFSSIILIPIAVFFTFQGSIYFIFFLSLLFMATSYEWIMMCKKKYLMNFFGNIFLIFSFFSAFYIRENIGLLFFLFIILICIFTDIGGYVFGKVLKGPKLTKISPNKTYSGVFGSFLISLSAGLFFLQYTNTDFLENDSSKILPAILFISLISQLGDLIISYFKRKAKLKNTGNILPGHGGLLDRIDGMIFVIPIIFILIFTVK
mgnify:FL=1|tara:strand:+ start:639 stop:1277 length:639 start_codon:yes stop_codon:yes gene_type:complete